MLETADKLDAVLEAVRRYSYDLFTVYVVLRRQFREHEKPQGFVTTINSRPLLPL
jgi:hypothetical protein